MGIQCFDAHSLKPYSTTDHFKPKNKTYENEKISKETLKKIKIN
jgi:hypothetical protein